MFRHKIGINSQTIIIVTQRSKFLEYNADAILKWSSEIYFILDYDRANQSLTFRNMCFLVLLTFVHAPLTTHKEMHHGTFQYTMVHWKVPWYIFLWKISVTGIPFLKFFHLFCIMQGFRINEKVLKNYVLGTTCPVMSFSMGAGTNL